VLDADFAESLPHYLELWLEIKRNGTEKSLESKGRERERPQPFWSSPGIAEYVGLVHSHIQATDLQITIS